MSSKPAKAPEGDTEEAPKKGKKKLIIIIAAVLVLALAGGAAAFFLMKGDPEEGDEEHAEDTKKNKEKDKKKKDKKKEHEAHPHYLSLERFTVNLIPEQGDQYLQISLSAELDAPESEAEVKTLLPKIRNGITLLLSSKKASEISNKEGKEKLSEELTDMINTIIEPPKKGRKPEGPVQAVLFTEFIIQ